MGDKTLQSTLIKTKALIQSLRLQATLLGPAGAYIGGLVAGAPYLSVPLLLAAVVVFLVGAGSMPLNDYFDRKIDAISHPERPIPQNILSAKGVLYFSFILFGIATVISYYINLLCFGIVLFSLIFLLGYEVLFKNYGFAGNITVAFLSAMAFTFGGAAVGNPLASFLFSVITFFLFIGIEVFKDVHDIKGDVLSRNTLPMRIGEKKAVLVGATGLIIAVLLTPLPYILYGFNMTYLVCMIIVDILWIYGAFITIKDIQNTDYTVRLLKKAAGFALLAIIIGALL